MKELQTVGISGKLVVELIPESEADIERLRMMGESGGLDVRQSFGDAATFDERNQAKTARESTARHFAPEVRDDGTGAKSGNTPTSLAPSIIELTASKGRLVAVTSEHDRIQMVQLASQEEVGDQIKRFILGTLEPLLAGREATLMPVLEGGLEFSAEIMKGLSIPFAVSSVKVDLQNGDEDKGEILLLSQLEPDLIRGRMVVILHDILGSSRTLDAIYDLVDQHNPIGVVSVFLVRKAGALAGRPNSFSLFEVPSNSCVVGVGMAHNHMFRHLRGILDLRVENY